jgi:hypothetical protein
LYQHLNEVFGDIDILFIGMECDGAPLSWLYGPLYTSPINRKNDQSRRFDGSTYEKGIAIVDILKPKQVYVYAMGQEPLCSFLTSIRYTAARLIRTPSYWGAPQIPHPGRYIPDTALSLPG